VDEVKGVATLLVLTYRIGGMLSLDNARSTARSAWTCFSS
jgi:hypothetical protein